MLDLGCGTGISIRVAGALPRGKLYWPGPGPGMVGYARAPPAGADSSWLLGDAEALPLAADSVDLVFQQSGDPVVSSPEQVFAEIGRALKPGDAVFPPRWARTH